MERQTVGLEEMRQRIGSEVGVSEWLLVDQAMIDRFADATHDHAFMHVDPVRAAAETDWGGTIAHGFLTLSLIAPLSFTALPVIDGVAGGVNYGIDKSRLIAPVRSGRRIRGRFELMELSEPKRGHLQVRYKVTIEIENEERPALVAEWLNRYFYRPPAA